MFQEKDGVPNYYFTNFLKCPELFFENSSNYHEDGIDPLKFALAQRQKTAIEHWKGNTKYTAMDAIMDMLNTARPIE
jgi:hypothetical protein